MQGLAMWYSNTEIYTPEQEKFINHIGHRFPRVKEGFLKYTQVRPETRLILAQHEAMSLCRTGYVDVGVPLKKIQTVGRHQQSAMLLAEFLYNNAKVVRMLKNHDVGESVIGDLTRRDPITKEEKHEIEYLALKLLLEKSDHIPGAETIMDDWLEFEEGKTSDAIQANDTDIVDITLMVSEYLLDYQEMKEGLLGFWQRIEPRIQTPEAKKFHHEIVSMHPQLHPASKLVAHLRN